LVCLSKTFETEVGEAARESKIMTRIREGLRELPKKRKKVEKQARKSTKKRKK